MATWSSGGIGNILATSSSARFGVGLQHARHEADVDAGRIHVAENAELAHGLDGGRQLGRLGPGAIAVDPAQDMLGGGKLGLFLDRRGSHRRRAQQDKRQHHGHCGTHHTSPVRSAPHTAARRRGTMRGRFVARRTFAAGTFRAACGYGKT